jgi:hypothetical protein
LTQSFPAKFLAEFPARAEAQIKKSPCAGGPGKAKYPRGDFIIALLHVRAFEKLKTES